MRKKATITPIGKPRPPKPRPSLWQRLRRFVASRHPVLVPLATFAVLIIFTLAGYLLFAQTKPVEAAQSRVVIVSHDGTTQTVPSTQPTVGALLHKLHIQVHKGDVVEPSAVTAINQDDFHINVYRGRPVEILDDGHKTFSFSAATTPRSIASQVGTKLHAEDQLKLIPTQNFIKDTAIGERVVIDRATPVEVNLYGHDTELRTQAKTVGDLLQEKHITLSKGAIVKPAKTSPIKPHMHIFILRKGAKVKTVSKKIDMPTKVIHDKHLSFGTHAVRQEGSPGKELITYKITTKNGKPVKKEIIQKVVVKKPVEKIVAKGIATPPPGDVKGDITYWANHYGVSPSYMLSIARCESRFNPRAKNPSGATGLFQFKPGTFHRSAAGAGIPDASIYDANAQARAAAWHVSKYGGGAWICG
jgi:uncharacterized protein YabE (DUF348 family)